METTGEKPGAGTYTCNNCGQVIILDDNTDTLPPCPKWNGTESLICKSKEFHIKWFIRCLSPECEVLFSVLDSVLGIIL